MLASTIFFVFGDTILKLVAETFPPGQVLALRGVVAVLITLGFIASRRQLPELRRAISHIQGHWQRRYGLVKVG